jgi:hypothetical protein
MFSTDCPTPIIKKDKYTDEVQDNTKKSVEKLMLQDLKLLKNIF